LVISYKCVAGLEVNFLGVIEEYLGDLGRAMIGLGAYDVYDFCYELKLNFETILGNFDFEWRQAIYYKKYY